MRALAQIMLNKEKGPEVFEEYMKIAFPWIETNKRRDRGEQIKTLMEEVTRGPLNIRPLWQKPVRSRLKTKVLETEPLDQKAGNRLYEKLGVVVPLR
jgi:hypothetical protein